MNKNFLKVKRRKGMKKASKRTVQKSLNTLDRKIRFYERLYCKNIPIEVETFSIEGPKTFGTNYESLIRSVKPLPKQMLQRRWYYYIQLYLIKEKRKEDFLNAVR